RGRVIYIIVMAFVASESWAWNSKEHVEIGTAAFHLACVRVRAEVARGRFDDNARRRFELACSALRDDSDGLIRYSPFVYEPLMGEWSALAADHTQSPEELVSVQLGDVAVDYRLFARLAVTDYRHFHPASITSWRADHLKSLRAAAAAGNRS